MDSPKTNSFRRKQTWLRKQRVSARAVVSDAATFQLLTIERDEGDVKEQRCHCNFDCASQIESMFKEIQVICSKVPSKE